MSLQEEQDAMLLDLIEGTLSDEQTRSMKEQLLKDPALRQEFEELRDAYQAAELVPFDEAPNDLADKIMNQISGHFGEELPAKAALRVIGDDEAIVAPQPQTGAVSWRSYVAPLALAATALIGVTVAMMTSEKNEPQVRMEESAATAALESKEDLAQNETDFDQLGKDEEDEREQPREPADVLEEKPQSAKPARDRKQRPRSTSLSLKRKEKSAQRDGALSGYLKKSGRGKKGMLDDSYASSKSESKGNADSSLASGGAYEGAPAPQQKAKPSKSQAAAPSPGDLHAAAKRAKDRNNCREAVRIYDNLFKSYPSYSRRRIAHNEAAECHRKLGNAALATQHARSAESWQPARTRKKSRASSDEVASEALESADQ